MERKIGEIFEYNGEWYQCVECDSCGKCSLRTTECGSGTKSDLADEVFGECSKIRRSDSKHAIFKKLEKVGEPMKIHGRLVLKVKADAYNCMRCCFYSKAKCELTIQECERYDCGEGTKFIEINKEDMEENNNAKHSNSEKIGKNLKPFDLEAAKLGKPVCTRDGHKARIICFDKKCLDEQILIALVDCGKEESMYFYTTDGKCIDDFSSFDLMMLPEKKEGWVNVYKNQIHNMLESAEEGHKGRTDYIKTIKVSWEE